MQAWHKKEKQKQIKKGKAEKQKQRTEKLARRNPDRIQKQIDELKAVVEGGGGGGGGGMSSGDKKLLAELERDLAAVRKAREAMGEKVPDTRRAGGGAPGGGAAAAAGAGAKRSAEEMENEARFFPSLLLDGLRGLEDRGGGVANEGDFFFPSFLQRRDSTPKQQNSPTVQNGDESDSGESTSSSVREIPMPPGPPPPLNQKWPRGPRQAHELPPKPTPPTVQTTYEAAPVLRDLRKESTAFVPAAIKRKMAMEKAARGGVEEEEEDGREERVGGGGIGKKVNAAPDVDGELSKFQAEMEEVEDVEA